MGNVAERVFSNVFAVIGGMACGAAVHFLSLALGLTATLPGSLWAASTGTLMLSHVRFKFSAPDPPELKQ